MRFLPNGIEFFLFENSFVLYYYGIILMAGVVLGGWMASLMAGKMGEKREKTWDLMVWLIIGGILGARLWHVFTPSPSLVAAGIDTWYYLTHPLAMLNTRNGGLGIPGAIIGGIVALYFFTRRNQLPFGTWLDISSFGLALGQAIGRWGNYVNQELYGSPTSLPWKIYIDPAHRMQGYLDQAYYHPLFLYESIWNLLNLGILFSLFKFGKNWMKTGDYFLVYVLIYSLGRFLLDFIRLDASMLSGINANQTFMGLVFLGAFIVLFYRLKTRLSGYAQK